MYSTACINVSGLLRVGSVLRPLKAETLEASRGQICLGSRPGQTQKPPKQEALQAEILGVCGSILFAICRQTYPWCPGLVGVCAQCGWTNSCRLCGNVQNSQASALSVNKIELCIVKTELTFFIRNALEYEMPCGKMQQTRHVLIVCLFSHHTQKDANVVGPELWLGT